MEVEGLDPCEWVGAFGIGAFFFFAKESSKSFLKSLIPRNWNGSMLESSLTLALDLREKVGEMNRRKNKIKDD